MSRHLVDLAVAGASIVDGELLGRLAVTSGRRGDDFVDGDLGEGDVSSVKRRWPVVIVCHIAVHQRVFADEVEHGVRQGPGVRHARPRPGLRHGSTGHRQPHGRRRRLFLELSVEGVLHVVQSERTDGRTSQAVGVGREDGVEGGVVERRLVNVLNLVEKEGKLARNRAVESDLQIRGPVLMQDVFASRVSLTNPSHSGVDGAAAVHVLDGHFAKEEVHVLADVVAADKIGFVQHVRVVLDGSLERVFASSSLCVENVSSEDDGVRFSEFGVGSGINGRMFARVSGLHPNGRGVVLRVEGALGDAVADPRVKLVPGQLGQVGVDDLVLWAVAVGAADVEPGAVRPDGLNDPDVVAAVVVSALALGDAVGHVVGLHVHRVTFAVRLGNIAGVKPHHPVHSTHEQSLIPFVQM